tara:strand:+ start:7419 stop:8270 length:852 start_codon:yes stop_codon:yes gene_type:complete
MLILYSITFIIIFIICYNVTYNAYGYLESHIFQLSSDIALNCKYITKYINKDHFSINATINNNIIASLSLYKWNNNNISNDFYIANHLFVEPKYRKNGIAKNIIRISSNKIIKSNGFGMFVTNFDLRIPDKLFQLYWTKMKKDVSYIQHINIIQPHRIILDNYPKHNWLSSEKTHIINTIRFNKDKVVHIQPSNIIVGVQSIIDSKGDRVCQIKWYWGNEDFMHITKSIPYLFGDDYIAIPSYNKPPSNDIWDMNNFYLYAKPKNIIVPPISNKDKLGWFIAH